MPEKTDRVTGVDFESDLPDITANSDVQNRLRCFELALCGSGEVGVDFSITMARAKAIYAWAMADEDGQAEPDPATTEDSCERRH